jgi:hypothetical protein
MLVLNFANGAKQAAGNSSLSTCGVALRPSPQQL